MKAITKTLTLAAMAFAFVFPALGGDEIFVGKWKAEFTSAVGQQKYTFEFKLEEGKLAGIVTGERQLGTNTTKLIELKTDKEEISFIEPVRLPGYNSELRVEYKGKLTGDEFKLHRKVAANNQYDIVAKRVKETDFKAEPKTARKNSATKTDNVPPSKP